MKSGQFVSPSKHLKESKASQSPRKHTNDDWADKKSWGKRWQHLVFLGGLPPKYWLGLTTLNFADRTRSGAFVVVWPSSRIQRGKSKFWAFGFRNTKTCSQKHSVPIMFPITMAPKGLLWQALAEYNSTRCLKTPAGPQLGTSAVKALPVAHFHLILFGSDPCWAFEGGR